MTPTTPLLTDAFVDAEGGWRDYVNTLTTDLVGPGKPLARGLFLKPIRSPAKGAYGYLVDVGGSDEWLDYGTSRKRLSASICGNTKEQALVAAVAYANRLLRTRNIQLTPAILLHVVDGISGPLYSPDRDEERYIVDADFYLHPTPTP